MSEVKKCSTCGIELPPDAPGGHCPQCLLQLGLRIEKAVVMPIAEKPGDRIDRYKLLQQIGEGGCGVVHMAEQDEPVRRRVALKIIKLGMDTKSVIARFEAERQALALMDHPNIAKVFDAGATDTGRPYFVMELVRGIKITDYCDQQKLSIRQRLDLFIQVCQAIQHAHQKGIIHRDIKPSNVLVTEQDGMAVPKIIDFGIAKATTDQRLTDKTLFTAFEQFIGTPAYMSPEQAGLGGLDIDTRSDIYSLGVLLYELLTGHQPFDSAELHRAALDEIIRTLREKEPPRPSARLTTLTEQELTLTAERHQAAPAKLSNLLRGDLDWIVMKALEKDRRRRYETANGFAADIQRHLENEPVVARPPSRTYRFGKMVRRNKFAFAAVSAVIAALIIGLGVSTWMFSKEQNASKRAITAEQAQMRLRRQAEADEKKARAEATKSQEVSQFLQEMLRGVGPQVALGRDKTLLREILDQTAKKLDEDLIGQPEVVADLCETLGVVYRDLGEYTNATTMLRESLQIRKGLHGDDDLGVASALNNLGQVLHRQSKLKEAEDSYREALAVQTKALGRENIMVAGTLNNLGSLLRFEGKYAEAEPMLREALAIKKKLLGSDSLAVADSLSTLAQLLREQGKFSEQEQFVREALALRKKLLNQEHPDIAVSLGSLATALSGQGRHAEAEVYLREAIDIQRKLFGGPHRDLGINLYFLANVLAKQDKLADAEAAYRESITMLKKPLGGRADRVLNSAYDGLLKSLQAQGKVAEVQALRQEMDEAGSLGTPLAAVKFSEKYTCEYGYFGKSGDSAKWKERVADGVFNFEELKRDTEFILIKNASRNITIQIPIRGGMSRVSTDNGATWQNLYELRKE